MKKLIKIPSRKDIIKVREYMIINLKQKNTMEPSKLFCDKVQYLHNKEKDRFDHHLMFYVKDRLVFKIWLPNHPKDNEFRDIHEALKNVGMYIFIPAGEIKIE